MQVGPVAQLGEHMVCNHGVGSSILPRSTNLIYFQWLNGKTHQAEHMVKAM